MIIRFYTMGICLDQGQWNPLRRGTDGANVGAAKGVPAVPLFAFRHTLPRFTGCGLPALDDKMNHTISKAPLFSNMRILYCIIPEKSIDVIKHPESIFGVLILSHFGQIGFVCGRKNEKTSQNPVRLCLTRIRERAMIERNKKADQHNKFPCNARALAFVTACATICRARRMRPGRSDAHPAHPLLLNRISLKEEKT